MRHKNVELIKAFAEGTPCEYYSHCDNRWNDVDCLSLFDTELRIQIKAEKRPDIVVTARVHLDVVDNPYMNSMDNHNLKMTFDGESRELITVKVIK
jgi:hypothetical protein